MNCLENWQFTNSSLVGVDEVLLVLTVLIKALDCVQLGNIEVAGDLAEVAMLMSEHATTTVAALLLFIEGSAIFCSKFFFGICCGFKGCQFFFSVCELTFFAVAAMIVLDPIFAQFSLVFLSCDLPVVGGFLGDCRGLFRSTG